MPFGLHGASNRLNGDVRTTYPPASSRIGAAGPNRKHGMHMRDNKEIEEEMALAIEERGPFESMPLLFTITEVAKYLQVSNTTVYRLIKDGALCGVRIGQSLRFTRKNIEDLLECCAVDENL